jgi:hypothetical protein
MVSREANIMKGSRKAAPKISETPIFDIAGDDSFARKGGAEIANVR